MADRETEEETLATLKAEEAYLRELDADDPYTEGAIGRRLFPPGIPCSMLRGLSDVYSREEIARIAKTPQAGLWRWGALGILAGND